MSFSDWLLLGVSLFMGVTGLVLWLDMTRRNVWDWYTCEVLKPKARKEAAGRCVDEIMERLQPGQSPEDVKATLFDEIESCLFTFDLDFSPKPPDRRQI